MLDKIFPTLNRGIEKLKSNPQLWYTIFVAVLILVAFIFVANRFVTIAQDAQDRLVNVRLGALQDSFVEFAPDYMDSDSGVEVLQSRIKKISFGNNTISKFKVVKFDNSEPVILASLLNSEVGKVDDENSFMYGIASTDVSNSFTLEDIVDGSRVYKTTRIITDSFGDSIGAVLTEQSLSEADIKISSNIQNSVLIFIIIVVLIMFLFFRHARIIDYTALYKKLKEVDQLKDDFVSMASHELRTPLTVIRGYAENLRESGPVNENQEISLKRIDIATKQLDDLVNDMLDVSRIEQGRMKVELQEINPIANISEIVEGFVSLAEAKGIKMKFTHELQTDIKINIDPARFKQVLTNIIGNSVKYTKEGEIKINLKKIGEDLVIRVSDTGFGMSAEAQKNLFTKFYRIQTDETREVRGTGLGLWITKQIVEIMKGTITVESIEGVGSHFIISFPKVK